MRKTHDRFGGIACRFGWARLAGRVRAGSGTGWRASGVPV